MREKLARSSGTPANTVEKRGGTLYGSSGSSLLRPSMPKTDPALPMQRMLPLLPMLRIEPALPMLKIEPVLPMRRIDPALPMLRTLKILPMLPTLSKLPMPNKPARPPAPPPRDHSRCRPERLVLRTRTPLCPRRV